MKGSFFVKKSIISLAALCILSVALCSAQTESALSLYNKGITYQQQENYYEAVDAFNEALQANEHYGDAWFHLAQCTYELGEFDLTVEYTNNAEKYSHNFSEIRNLRGMSFISLGKLKDARTVFEGVLKEFPNDVDARFGLGLLDLFDGSLSAAQQKYADALKRQNSNKTALLSLALISAEMGKNDLALQYVDQALAYHSGEAQVHYLASYLAAKRGDYVEAERRARSAVQIRGNYDQAYELLANILYTQKRYNEVVDMCDFRLGRNRSLSTAWYLRGLAEERLGQNAEAISSFITGLSVDPQDELQRAALEQLVEQTVPVEDTRRESWASYHLKRAAEYKRNYDGQGERYEYQQALKIDPLNKTARQSFANLLNRDGLYELYLSQLQFIAANNSTAPKTTGVQTNENTPAATKSAQEVKNDDAVEALSSMLSDTLSKKWNVDPFYLDKTRWNIGIYYKKAPVQLIHADAEQITAIAAQEIFSGIPSTAVSVQTQPVSGYADAYKQARTSGCDYFIIVSIDETERTMRLTADIYSARTGTATNKITVYRTGNDRYANVLRRFRQGVIDLLPIRGKVLDHAGTTLLVDLGKNDGVVKDAVFDVVKKGSIFTVDKGAGISYPESAKLGTLTLTTVNEEISEGTFQKLGFYDLLNNNDEVVLVKLPSQEEGNTTPQNGTATTDTRPAADNKGQPVTPAAQKAEKDSEKIAKSLTEPGTTRESSLINMIRSIE